MWMPRKWRSQLSTLRDDADARLAAARDARTQAEQAARRSAPVAARSAELTDANSIAAAIAESIRGPARSRGGNQHAP